MVLPVHASNYDVQTLIPIDTEASVSTDTITYQNFIYHSASDDKGNCTLSFSSISKFTFINFTISFNSNCYPT